MTDAFIYDAVRTPRGKGRKDGSLHEVTPVRLAVTALQAIRDRNKLDTHLVDDIVLGCVMTCSIVTVDRQLTAVVKAKVPFPEIPNAQRSARAAVDAALPSLEAGPLGRPLTRFRTPARDALDMEIGTIVGRSFAAKGQSFYGNYHPAKAA